MQEIDRCASIERNSNFDNITRFNRRMARFTALLPPGEAPNFADQLLHTDLWDWVETQAEFRAWLCLNKLT